MIHLLVLVLLLPPVFVGLFYAVGTFLLARLHGQNVVGFGLNLRLLCTEFGTAALSMLFFPLTRIFPVFLWAQEADAPAFGRPILLLHGYGQSMACYGLLATRLHRVGLGPIYLFNLAPYLGPIEEQASRVSQQIDQILRETGKKDVDIVAHSMGGLCALSPEVNHGQRVRRIVSIGTPFQGTKMARFAIGQAARQICPSSAFLNSLPTPRPGQLLAISSAHDSVVVPNQSAQAGAKGRDVVFEGVGHLGLLFDARVAEEVVRALREDVTDREFRPLKTKTADLCMEQA